MRHRRLALIVLGSGVYFVALALANASHVNVDPVRHDQQAYLDQARMLAETSFHGFTNRVEMPIFPYILALFYSPRLDPTGWFWRGKVVAIGVALVVSMFFALLARRLLPASAARLVTIVCVFYVFLPRAAYVQVEVIYYFLALSALLALVSFVRTPTFPRAALAGALAAIAWLAKASFLLPLGVFTATFVVRELVAALRGGSRRDLALHLATAAVVVVTFAALVYPYARKSREWCGSYLYNTSATYVIFCDGWEDFVARMASLGSPADWWKLADKTNVPSMSRYLATHSVLQVFAREIVGLALVVGNFLLTPCAPFAIALGVTAAVVLRRRPDVRARLFRWDPRAPWLPVVAYFVVHALALGFYGVIGANARFSLSVVVPGFVLLAMGMSPQGDLLWQRAERLTTRLAVAGLAVVVPVLMFTVYFGG